MRYRPTGFPTLTITAAYQARFRRKLFLMAVLIGTGAILAVYAVALGSYDLSGRVVINALLGKSEGPEAVVVWSIRLPRIAAAVITGWGLSLAGLFIQSVLRNPLGSPSTLGISQGAAFGASAAIVLFGSGFLSVSVFAFVGAVCATLVIIALARFKRLSPEAIILAGVALSSLFTSATILLQYLASEIELAKVVFWAFGDVARSNWRQIGSLAVVTFLVTLLFMRAGWDVNAIAAGEETATGLGVNVAFVRTTGMLAVTVVTALATAFHGIIAFIGLIAPHMARRLVGDDHRLLVPLSGILGGLLLLAADVIGRLVVGSGAMPVGVISSFLGAPMFLYLLLRGKS
jgi:iron complex transport system permease protein